MQSRITKGNLQILVVRNVLIKWEPLQLGGTNKILVAQNYYLLKQKQNYSMMCKGISW